MEPAKNTETAALESPDHVRTSHAAAMTMGLIPGSFYREAKLYCLNLLLTYHDGCVAFYCKHRDEMEEIGVPGIIIDIDDRTCYDLGREKEAYQGTFEGYTTLKTDLLSKLCRAASTKHLVRVGSE